MKASASPLVLVADDEPSMLELVARHLRTMSNPKLEVIQASDGEEAWRLAREHLPDLVVLDVMMPGMSGWEVCRKIREDIGLAHTGVVMLTGIGENLNQMTSPLYGADAYIDKPFEFADFDGKVRTTLAKYEGQRKSVDRAPINGTAGAAKPLLAKVAKAAKAVAKKVVGAATKTSAKPASAKTKAASSKKAAAPAKKAAAKSAAPKTTKKATKATSKKTAPKKAAPKKAAPKKAAPTRTKKAPTKKASTKKAARRR